MDIPFEAQKCVVFVGYKPIDGTEKLAGSAFLVVRPSDKFNSLSFSYVVTASHIIEGISDKGLDKILLRINRKSGTARWIETSAKDWHFHPNRAIDVAVLRFSWLVEMDHFAFPIKQALDAEIIRQQHIGVGNEVFLAGLFNRHYGEQNNLPIVRVGNIAAMPSEKLNTKRGKADGYLIEVRSIGGLSGSPVFLVLGSMRSIAGITLPNFLQFYLLGVMHGHFDETEDDVVDEFVSPDASGSKTSVNMGIAVVTPAEKVLEVILSSEIAEVDADVEQAYRSQYPPSVPSKD